MKAIAVVTGAAGGMGLATAREFQLKGFKVIGVDQRPSGGNCNHFFQGDICDEKLWMKVRDFIEVIGRPCHEWGGTPWVPSHTRA